ncbi:MAG TPA: asparaginase [Pyrinomonadaceae bacterium]|nr:asparaginase [Pyrinomonadaceae bacterium]
MNREASLIVSERREEQAALGAPPSLFVEVRRGAITESRHHGHLSVLDGEGRALFSKGAPETVTYLRSSAKPQQVIPLITTGAADRFRFTGRELAVACGSHNGEAEHRETVASMLEKIGLDETALRCGAHEPYGEEAAEELKRRGEKPSALHNNCSGKHAMMLALAVHLKASVEDYERFEHPVQQLIARTVAQFADARVEEMGIGIDGCAAPNFAVPVHSMALMYARLVRPPLWFDEATREACGRVVSAMMAHPEMVEGRGELDTSLMKACGGSLVSKVGAEGVYTAGVLPCESFPEGLGLAFKIEDGDKGDRARSPLAVEVLRQLGVINEREMGELQEFARKVIRNHRGDRVGESAAVLDLRNEQRS